MSETETRATTERDALASLIWTTSRADESTISATGANIVADAILRSEWLGRLTEPAATLAQMIDPIRQAFEDAGEHIECPLMCESCGERLADTICPQCNGGGCLPNAAMAYLECDTCAGVGRIHEGCVEASYAELAAEVARLRAVVEAVQALAPTWMRNEERSADYQDGLAEGAEQLTTALAPVSSSGEAESGEALDRVTGKPPTAYTPPEDVTYRCRSCGHLTVNEPPRSCAVCEAVTPAPVLSGGQADGEGEATRALMKAMGCRRVPRTGVLANSFYDYCERHPRSLGYGDWDIHRRECPEARRLAGVALAARPVLSREALRERLTEHRLVQRGLTAGSPDRCACGAETRPARGDEDADVRRGRAFAGHLADVLAGGEQRG